MTQTGDDARRDEPTVGGHREPLTDYQAEDGRYVYEPPLPESMPELPFTVRMRRRRWFMSLVFGLFGCVLFPVIAFAPGGDGSAMLVVFRVGALLVWPVAILVAVHAGQAILRPRHLHFDAERVWTRDWSLDWVDVLDLRLLPDNWRDSDVRDVPKHKQQLMIVISAATHAAKVGAGNRWDSGYPFGLGGLAPINGMVMTQYDSDPPIRDAYLVMKVLQRDARKAAGLPTYVTRPFAPGKLGPLK